MASAETLDVLAGQRQWHCQQTDLLDFLPTLPEKSIDLVLGSPPYEAQRTYGIDFNLKGQEWVDWMVRVFKESLRVCRGLVCMVLEGHTKNYRWSAVPVLLMADLHRAGIHLRKPPCYSRDGIPGSGGPDWWRNDWEFCICATSGGRLPWSDNTATGSPPKYGPGGVMSNHTRNGRVKNGKCIGGRLSAALPAADPKDKAGTRNMSSRAYTLGAANRDDVPHARHGGRSGEIDEEGQIVRKNGKVYRNVEIANPGNVIHCVVGGGKMGSRIAHETEAAYPEKLVEPFIRCFCPPGGIVLDPFAGSGTTLAVAVRWGRRALGCDLRQSQVDLTARRIAEELSPKPARKGCQPRTQKGERTLFDEEAK